MYPRGHCIALTVMAGKNGVSAPVIFPRICVSFHDDMNHIDVENLT